ncbi:p115 like vesicle tethering protein [Dichotomocladium elegans]|nr:p115 like vesicle tethering protein [Dichotomocladium elegans]
MEFFTRGYNAIRGDKGQPQSVDETVEKLADCLETATLLEDRRAAVLSLKGLAVGRLCFVGLIKILHTDHHDGDITKSTLETINVLCTLQHQSSLDDPGYVYTDKFIEDPTNVSIVLDILEEYDFYVRYSALKFLSTLSANRNSGVQQSVLTSPMGIARLVDLLSDKRDIIRNESLLLLINLTQNNTEIQKIVAFQATFEKLLAVIEDEEGISGGIIVQDSLTLMHHLLRYNVSNQIYFRETSCIQAIPGLLGYVGDSDADHVPFSYEDWPPQKIANTVLVLGLCRILTEPDGANTSINQKIIAQSNTLLPIVQLAVCSNAPSIVRTEALYSVAYLIYGNIANQDLFTKTVVACPLKIVNGEVVDSDAPVGLPRPAMVSLIAIALDADPSIQYSYSSRAAAAFAVLSSIEGHPDAQVVLAATLKTPPEDNANTQFADKPFSFGSLLLDYIENWEFSANDPYKLWFACTILSYVIRDSDLAKQVAGGIVFGDEANGEEPVPLLHHIVAQLMMAARNPTTNSRIPIAYLCLLCTWLYNNQASVSLFLSESTHIQFLIQEVQSSANDPIVQGLIAFLLGIAYDTLSRLRDSAAIKNSPQYLQISAEDESISANTGSLPSLLLEPTFVEFFKDTYGNVERTLFSMRLMYVCEVSSPTGSEQEIATYKTTIHTQANEILALKQQIEAEKVERAAQTTHLDKKIAELEKLLTEAERDALNSKAEALKKDKSELEKLVETMREEQEDLLVCMGEQTMEMKKYKARLRHLGEEVTDSEDEDE